MRQHSHTAKHARVPRNPPPAVGGCRTHAHTTTAAAANARPFGSGPTPRSYARPVCHRPRQQFEQCVRSQFGEHSAPPHGDRAPQSAQSSDTPTSIPIRRHRRRHNRCAKMASTRCGAVRRILRQLFAVVIVSSSVVAAAAAGTVVDASAAAGREMQEFATGEQRADKMWSCEF